MIGKTQEVYVPTLADLDWFDSYIQEIDWVWASSFADNYPHMFIVRGDQVPEEEYGRMFRIIQRFGVPKKFFKRVNIELFRPELALERYGKPGRTHRQVGLKFWPMENLLQNSQVINVAPDDSFYGEQDAPDTHSSHTNIYDGLAPEYDPRYLSRKDRAENIEMWRRITAGDHVIRDILDLGCGTGLTLDLRLLPKQTERYRGVDPSQAMLNNLIFKHRWATDLYPMTAEDYLRHNDGRTFDTVLALFGSPSYMHPDTIRALPSLAERRIVLMHYREGYFPDYHSESTKPPLADESREAAAALPGAEVSFLNNFQVVEVG